MNYRMLSQALLERSNQMSIEITQDTCTATHYSLKTNCDNGQMLWYFDRILYPGSRTSSGFR